MSDMTLECLPTKASGPWEGLTGPQIVSHPALNLTMIKVLEL
jgi:hypothetical protein